MLERNPLSTNRPPVGRVNPNLNSQKRRKRNGWLVLIILAFAAVIIWKVYPIDNRFIPYINSDPVPPVVELHPIVSTKQAELIAATKKIGITILVTDGFRSSEEQDAIHAQGRTAEGSVVTHARGGQSYHNYGLAIDFALRTTKGAVVWDMEYDGNKNGKPDWMEVVAIAKELGFSWGGDWKNFKDYPHLQMDFGYSIRQLQRGARPPTE